MGQVIGERVKKHMKKKIKYTDEPMDFEIIDDIFPQPEELVLQQRKQRITIELSNKSLSFFKNFAKKQRASYQAMIRNLLDHYVARLQIKMASS